MADYIAKEHTATILQPPTEHCDFENLKRQMDCFNALPFFKQGLDATNSMILVLNACRQVIFANQAFLDMVKVKDVTELFGKRPGDILQCVNACDAVNGCGTSEACKYCNAVSIILRAMASNEQSAGEFSNINRLNGYEQNVNLSIHVAPLQVEQETFYVVSFADNSDAVRRRMLERTFFHDIINTAGGLKGIIGLLKDDVPEAMKPEMEFVENNFIFLLEEIENQKDMMDAENNQLMLTFTEIHSTQILQAIRKLYAGHEISINKTIQLDEHCVSKLFYSDVRLLRRILGNMVKNALEASAEGSIITIGCSMDGEKTESIKFWVHNISYMDKKVRSLVFHRSFSTRGYGRGLGTYSIKFLGENYLKGKVGFVTDKKNGTTFYIELPFQQTPSEG